jgi:hypothetical protein
MPGDERDAGGLRLLQRRRLFDSVKAVDDDAVRLQGHGLAEGRRAAADRTGAVENLDLPADRGSGLLYAGGDAKNATVLQIAGEHDDGLAVLHLRPGRRPIPGADLACIFLDQCLGLGHRIGQSGVRAEQGHCRHRPRHESPALHFPFLPWVRFDADLRSSRFHSLAAGAAAGTLRAVVPRLRCA